MLDVHDRIARIYLFVEVNGVPQRYALPWYL